LELKDKCKNMEIVAGTAMKTGAVMKSTHGPVSDALSALQNLGYSPSEAYHVLGSIEKKEDLDSASLIRLCLQSLKVGGAA
jgi:Holliday junction resolvasome RuvABC DNA-binding subunit